MFDPKTDKFPYPILTDGHYLKIKKDDGTVFDEDYPYIGHYLNMRKASYTKVACGIAISEDGTKGWFNMNFY